MILSDESLLLNCCTFFIVWSWYHTKTRCCKFQTTLFYLHQSLNPFSSYILTQISYRIQNQTRTYRHYGLLEQKRLKAHDVILWARAMHSALPKTVIETTYKNMVIFKLYNWLNLPLYKCSSSWITQKWYLLCYGTHYNCGIRFDLRHNISTLLAGILYD